MGFAQQRCALIKTALDEYTLLQSDNETSPFCVMVVGKLGCGRCCSNRGESGPTRQQERGRERGGGMA